MPTCHAPECSATHTARRDRSLPVAGSRDRFAPLYGRVRSWRAAATARGAVFALGTARSHPHGGIGVDEMMRP